MKRQLCLTVLMVLLLPLTILATCPNCFNNQTPMQPRHGETGDGRRIINVAIRVGSGSESWASVPGGTAANGAISRAVGEGMGKWNSSSCSMCIPPEPLKYYFGTTTDPAQVDILVVKMPHYDQFGHENAPARMETGGSPPYKLFVREDIVSVMGAEDMAAMMAHEIGHRIGLAHSSECNGSIMMGSVTHSDGTISAAHSYIESWDVYTSNRQFNYNTRSECTATDDLKDEPFDDQAQIESGGDGGSGGGDSGGGSGSTCFPQYVESCGYNDSCSMYDEYSGTCYGGGGYDWCTGYWVDCP